MRLSIDIMRADNYQAYGDLDAQQAQERDMEAVTITALLKAAARNQSSCPDAMDAGGNIRPLSPCWW